MEAIAAGRSKGSPEHGASGAGAAGWRRGRFRLVAVDDAVDPGERIGGAVFVVRPLCTTHNLLKERGFRVDRDDKGNLHTIDPHGTEIT